MGTHFPGIFRKNIGAFLLIFKIHERHFGLMYQHRKRENKEFFRNIGKKRAILGIFGSMKKKLGISRNLGAEDSFQGRLFHVWQGNDKIKKSKLRKLDVS
jgi:hypothetical protein